MKLYSTGLWLIAWFLFVAWLVAGDQCAKKDGKLAGFTCIKKEVVLK
jgi:hypothetical protein